MGPEMLKGIQQGLRAGDLRPALIIFGVCSFLLLLLMLRVYMRRLGTRRRVEGRWREFRQALRRAHLTTAERETAVEMASKEVPESPSSILQELETFESAVHRYLNPRVVHGEADDAAELVRGLREKLGFAENPGRIYCSTRGLQPGQQLLLGPAGEAGAGRQPARVARRREDVLEVEGLDRPEELPEDVVSAEFTAEGRIFGFETEVLGVEPEAGRCRLGHTLDVRAMDSREFYRTEVDKNITIRAGWEEEDVRRQMLLENLSAGGAALLGGCYYEEGERLILHIDPGQLGERAVDEDRELGPRDVEAMVLAAETVEQRCRYRVEFQDVEPETRQFLFRMVQKLELRARRAEQ